MLKIRREAPKRNNYIYYNVDANEQNEKYIVKFCNLHNLSYHIIHDGLIRHINIMLDGNTKQSDLYEYLTANAII